MFFLLDVSVMIFKPYCHISFSQVYARMIHNLATTDPERSKACEKAGLKPAPVNPNSKKNSMKARARKAARREAKAKRNAQRNQILKVCNSIISKYHV